MPTYDYKCEVCEHAFEEYQSITAKPLRKCPSCGQNRLKRIVGCGAGVIFKGSGFYQTDYRSESYKTASKADSAGESGKTESKPSGAEPPKPEPKKEKKAESTKTA